MKHYLKKLAPIALAVFMLSISCSETSTTTSKEETEISSLDSSNKAAKETADKLEEQTNKVEASLEKLDDEFKANN